MNSQVFGSRPRPASASRPNRHITGEGVRESPSDNSLAGSERNEVLDSLPTTPHVLQVTNYVRDRSFIARHNDTGMAVPSKRNRFKTFGIFYAIPFIDISFTQC